MVLVAASPLTQSGFGVSTRHVEAQLDVLLGLILAAGCDLPCKAALL